MSTAIQVTPNLSSRNKNSTSNSTINSASPRGNTPPDDECATSHVGDNTNIPIINDVESLKKGIIKSSANNAKAPYTILLIGETGVGKSSVVELLANILDANGSEHYDFGILDRSQADSARLYEFKSRNGVVVRILDTPGLADTRNPQQDAFQKKRIAAQVKEHIDSVTAVLVLANGTVPRANPGTNHALSALSAIFPRTPHDNVAFLLTNTSNSLFLNFSKEILPEAFKDAPQFLLNNPVALQRKYLQLRDEPNTRSQRPYFREAVKASEKDSLEMLVDLFDWLARLELQPMTRTVSLYEHCQNIVAKLTNRLAQQAKELRTAIKDKVEAGVRRVSRMLWAS